MNIGQAARRSGISAKMIRYYEKIGLIPPAARSESNYREYTGADVERLSFINRSRNLGFSVEEIQGLLDLWRDRSRKSADVKRIAQHHITQLKAKIRSLEELVQTLEELVESCQGDHEPGCPIIDELESNDVASTTSGLAAFKFGVKKRSEVKAVDTPAGERAL